MGRNKIDDIEASNVGTGDVEAGDKETGDVVAGNDAPCVWVAGNLVMRQWSAELNLVVGHRPAKLNL